MNPSARRQAFGRAVVSAALSLPLGAVAFAPLFIALISGSVELTNWSPSGFAFASVSLAAYAFFGMAIGYLNSHLWQVAGALACIAVIDALYNLAYLVIDVTYPREALPVIVLVLVGPMLGALGGSYAGSRLARSETRAF